MRKRFVAYYRVSTKKQNGDMASQKTAVKNYLKNFWPPEKSFTEVESGAKNGRPKLLETLKYCKEKKCILVVAKLDRLSRDLTFISSLQKSNVEFVCADMPEANSLTINLLGCLAQWEREQIGERTRLALAEKRKAGVKLGSHNPKVKAGLAKYHKQCAIKRAKKAKLQKLEKEKTKKAKLKGGESKKAVLSKKEVADKTVWPTIKALRLQKLSYEKIAQTLNQSGIKTRYGYEWSQKQVIRVAKRNTGLKK